MVVAFGDLVALLIERLSSAVVVPVHKRVPNPRPESFVTVQRSGGSARDLVVDDGLYTIECWGNSDEVVADLVSVIRGELLALAGQRLSDGTQIYRVSEAGGPVDLPDSLSDSPRVRWTIEVQSRGLVA